MPRFKKAPTSGSRLPGGKTAPSGSGPRLPGGKMAPKRAPRQISAGEKRMGANIMMDRRTRPSTRDTSPSVNTDSGRGNASRGRAQGLRRGSMRNVTRPTVPVRDIPRQKSGMKNRWF